MSPQTSKTFLALALALGLAGQASAQAPQVRRPPASNPKPSAGSVKVIQTDEPAEQTPAPTADSTTAQGTGTGAAMAQQQPAAAAAGANQHEEMAITAGRDWLALVDGGRFPESYDQAGELFRGALPRDQWAAALGNSRKPLGNVLQRNLKSVVVTQDLPNAPQGKYVVATFDTSFQQQAQPLYEVLTAFLDQSGQWKVVGYQVKPHEGAAAQKPAQQ
jgi:hypothetical protein